MPIVEFNQRIDFIRNEEIEKDEQVDTHRCETLEDIEDSKQNQKKKKIKDMTEEELRQFKNEQRDAMALKYKQRVT